MSAQTPLVFGPPARYAAAFRYTTETLKTHKTDLGEVVYPWHPFYGKAVKIKGKRNRRGTIVYICSSDGNDGGAVVEVPAWMFDSAVCCLLHPGGHPSVWVPALRALHALLNWTRKPTEDVIEAHQSTAVGGSDAQANRDAGDSDTLFPAPARMQPLSPDINRKIVTLLARLLRQHADRNTGAPSNGEDRHE